MVGIRIHKVGVGGGGGGQVGRQTTCLFPVSIPLRRRWEYSLLGTILDAGDGRGGRVGRLSHD